MAGSARAIVSRGPSLCRPALRAPGWPRPICGIVFIAQIGVLSSAEIGRAMNGALAAASNQSFRFDAGDRRYG
jgi:hypothetical protein